MYKLTSEMGRPLPSTSLMAGRPLLLLVAKGQRKDTFLSVCVSASCWLPEHLKSPESRNLPSACSATAASRASSLPGLASGQRPRQFPPRGAGLWKRQGREAGHGCVVALPRGSILPSRGSLQRGPGRPSHSVPAPGAGSGWA